MTWLLVADVRSQPAKRHGHPGVIAWLETHEAHCYTSAIVIAQLAYWVRCKEGRERTELQAWLRELVDSLEGRIIGFNVALAHVWAEQKHQLEAAGVPMPVEASLIAATARRHGLIVATGNDRHFRRPGIKVFNPFKKLPTA